MRWTELKISTYTSAVHPPRVPFADFRILEHQCDVVHQ